MSRGILHIRIAVLLLLWLASVATASDTVLNSADYVDKYNLVDRKMDSRVGIAEQIFNRLKRLDSKVPVNVELKILKSDNKPWAMALPDNTIILSRGALDIIYSDDDLERANAALAFVLGHELAHLASSDHWHQTIHDRFAPTTDSQDLRQEPEYDDKDLHIVDIQKRELGADLLGFTTAALGGYAVERLLEESPETTDFLTRWVQQTDAIESRTHPQPDERIGYLRVQLKEMAKHIKKFDTAVRLAHFGRHADALVFLEDFFQHYRSSVQARSNLGYLYIQLAREEMPTQDAYWYWMPTMLETDSGLPDRPRGLNDELSTAVLTRLEQAVRMLRHAVDANTCDLVASINLSVAHYYLKQHHYARGVTDQLINNPSCHIQLKHDKQLLALRAIVMLAQDPGSVMESHVIDILEMIAEAKNVPVNILFNLARVLETRGREGGSNVVWNRLAEHLSELPTRWAAIVCEHIETQPNCSNTQESFLKPDVLDELFPVRPSQTLKSLGSVGKINRESGSVGGVAFTHIESTDYSLLAIKDVVEIVVVRPPSGWTLSRLAKELGPSRTVIRQSSSAKIHGFAHGVAALIEDEVITELWLGAK